MWRRKRRAARCLPPPRRRGQNEKLGAISHIRLSPTRKIGTPNDGPTASPPRPDAAAESEVGHGLSWFQRSEDPAASLLRRLEQEESKAEAEYDQLLSRGD